MKTVNPWKIALSAGALALLLAGCGQQTPTATSSAPATSEASAAVEPSATAASSQPDLASFAEYAMAAVAVTAAEAEVPNSQAISVDHNDDGTWTVEVIEGSTEHDIYLAATGTEVLRHTQGDADSDELRRLGSVQVPLVQALAAAVVNINAPVLDDAELDDDDDRIAWQIDLSSPDRDVYVDASSGEVFER